MKRVLAIACMAAPLMLCCLTSPKRGGMGSPHVDTTLKYTLKARESYPVGQPVIVGFTLENGSDRTVYVLKWYTPLEGLYGNIFRVTRDGVEIPYAGPLAKRGDPQPDDYVEVRPRSTVSAEVDLAPAYNLSQPANYRVEFDGKLHDIATNKSSLPRTRDKQRGESISGNAVIFRIVAP